MRLTNKAVLIGLLVIGTAYYWLRFVPNNWDRWSEFQRDIRLTRGLVLLTAIVVLGGIVLFRRWRQRNGDK